MSSNYSALRKQYLTEWRIWYRMCYRCQNDLQYYVETEVCEEWQGEQGFINWFDHMGPRPTGNYILDRINKLDDYRPGNCHWVLKDDAHRKMRLHETDRGRWHIVARENGIKKHTFYSRIRQWGWDIQDAATMPPGVKGYHKRKL